MTKGFLLVPEDRMFDTAEAAARAIRPPWDFAQLRATLSTLQPGDELEVSDTVSFIALSGTTRTFTR